MITEKINIEDIIYEIRGKQVMLDRNIAKLYMTETRRINEIVKRNIKRFPADFCFQMSNNEFIIWKSQNAMSNEDKIGLRRPPYVFTEQGVAMLSALINTDIAVLMSIRIVNAFVEMKKYLSTNSYERRIGNIETKIIDYDNKLDEVFKKLDNTVNNHIFFEGQIYDAYSKIIDIFI